jgi:hypothetical protein
MIVYACSDLEGYSPTELLPDYEKIKKDKKNTIIFCGDLIDSTITGQKDILGSIKSRKSKNIINIFDIVMNHNILLTFGNRDLNKIKVGPLTELAMIFVQSSELKDKASFELVKKLVNEFNKGKINLDYTTYETLNNSISTFKWVQKMSNWYPFWGGALKDKINYWKDDREPIDASGFFDRRFQKIFGKDTARGTMSAEYLLETIPLELGLYRVGDNNYNAFVVLAVFKSMLQKKKFIDTNNKLSNFFYPDKSKEVSKDVINTSLFEGLLYTMFTDRKNDMIIKMCNCDSVSTKFDKFCVCKKDLPMYLFSHGGISSDIINKDTLDELSNLLKNSTTTTLVDKLTDANKLGGYYANIQSANANIKTNEDIINKIRYFNEKMKRTIQDIFDEDYTTIFKPTNNMLLLLIASATFKCEPFYTKVSDEATATRECEKLGITNILKTSSDFISTMAGIKNLRNNEKIFFNNNTLYNIFGHSPNGFGPTIDLFENNKNKTYLINLDTSNTFLSSDVNKYDEKNTYSYIKIENNKVEINTNIHIKTTKSEELNINTSIDYFQDFEKKGTEGDEKTKNDMIIAYTEESKKVFINDPANDIKWQNGSCNITNIMKDSSLTTINIKNIIDDNMDTYLKNIGANKNIFYHGKIVGIQNKVPINFIVLTDHRTLSFPKCLFILNETEFKAYFDKKKGGSYLKKYLKYKNKYIQLKNQIEEH